MGTGLFYYFFSTHGTSTFLEVISSRRAHENRRITSVKYIAVTWDQHCCKPSQTPWKLCRSSRSLLIDPCSRILKSKLWIFNFLKNGTILKKCRYISAFEWCCTTFYLPCHHFDDFKASHISLKLCIHGT